MNDDTVEPKRLVFPGLAGLYRSGSRYAYAFMRFCTGAALVPHGVQKLMALPPTGFANGLAHKGMPFALVLAWAVVFTESFAAAFLALGLFTRFCAVAIWLEMAVIIAVYQWPNGYFWTEKGIEFALLWLLLCTAIFFRGGGRYSIDRYLGREL